MLKKEEVFEFSKKYNAENKGIGLAISKKIVETLGGSIDVLSSPNKGFTTLVSLPAA